MSFNDVHVIIIFMVTKSLQRQVLNTFFYNKETLIWRASLLFCSYHDILSLVSFE